MWQALRDLLAAAAVLAGLAAALIAAYLFSGRYDIAASEPHFDLVARVLDGVFHASVEHHAREPTSAELDSVDLAMGAQVYATHCSRCHSLPGAERPSWAAAMRPAPPDLPRSGTEFELAEIYWLVRNGAKMTGMPAWRDELSSSETWSVSALVAEMPDLGSSKFRELMSQGSRKTSGDSR